MVKTKTERFDFVKAAQEANERLGEVIGHKYVVFEVTPGYTDSGYYGEVEHPAKRVKVFDAGNLHAISDWQDNHEPDKGKYFVVQKFEQRRRVVVEWFPDKIVFDGKA